ncbi:MAG: DUF4215 domain-containing protein, partial [Deltaproteobacteria bacterium]|nr:DUF4215 domain-containing protein [Deltaproteobacteria bacterium]
MAYRSSTIRACKIISAACLLAATLCHPPPALCADPAPLTEEFLTGQDLSALGGYECDLPSRRLRIAWQWIAGSDDFCDIVLERGELGSAGFESRVVKATASCSAPAELVCGEDGDGVVVVGQGYGAPGDLDLFAFDAAGRLLGPAHTISSAPDCYFPEYWLLVGSAELRAVGNCRDSDGASHVSLHRLSLGDSVEPPPVQLSDADGAWNTNYHAAVDDAGDMLVAWNESPYAGPNQEYEWQIYARAVAAGGTPLGQVIRVDTFRPAHAWILTAATAADGIFNVYWEGALQGGQVGRTISIDPDLYFAAATTTTTLPPAADAPVFDLVRTVGGYGEADEMAAFVEGPLAGLTGDGNGALLLHRWNRFIEYRDYTEPATSTYLSSDAGLRWSRTDAVPPVQYGQDSPPWEGGARSGTLVSARVQRRGWDDEEGGGFDIVSFRSTDGGNTWPDASVIGRIYCGDCDEFLFQEVALAGDRQGNWMAASISSDRTSNGDPEIYHAAITVAFSYDDGRTWTEGASAWRSPPIEIECCGTDPAVRYSIAAVAGRDGSWGLVWRSSANGGVWAARTADAQSEWIVTSIAAPFARPPEISIDQWWDSASPYGRPAIATTPSSHWVVAWEEEHAPAQYGVDGDIFFATSGDDGKTWSDPATLSAYAAIDGAKDSEPSLASDGDGRVLAVWSSHDPLGDTVGTDSDVLSSLSTDGGVTWSPPAPVDPAAADDDRQDISPRVAGDAQGRWTVAWTSMSITARWWRDDPEDVAVKVAVAGNRCGNDVVEAGEQCDGGIGCNANCTATGCGNEVLDAGEECDDGNLLADDHCSASCTAAFCGDGIRNIWAEQCDDGNGSENDQCPGTCTRPYCGDGFVRTGVEECDDGNTSQTDACLNSCAAARCGDGMLREEVEVCDDGDQWSGNACTDACQAAFCGDGAVWFGVEECDPADPFFDGGCTADCKLTNPCDIEGACG